MDIINDIAKTTIKLLIQEPFYGHYFTHIQRQLNTEIERISISVAKTGNIVLEVNPVYWEKLELDAKIGCIKHQILHVVFEHVYKANKFGNKKLFNIAADLVVNQYLLVSQLAPDAITLDYFPFLNLKTNESIAYYYKKLQENDFEDSFRSNLSDSEQGNDISDSGNEDQKDNNEGSNQFESLKEHKSWDTFENQTGIEQKITNEKLDSFAQMSASRIKTEDFGSLPGVLQTYIKEAEERLNPIVNWKRLLRLHMQSSRKTYLKTTMKKPSRRYGTVPGIKIKQQQKVLIAVDTSGSIDEEELGNFFSEIYHIWKQTSEIMIVLCDTRIHDQYLYNGTTPKVVGGGGTSFDPPIDFANIYKPDVLLYFTDGHANVPTVKSRVPIIWIVSSGIDLKDFPGRKVNLT